MAPAYSPPLNPADIFQMFDTNGMDRTVDNDTAEDTRVVGYDPMIPPALIQEEIPAVTTHLARVQLTRADPRIIANGLHRPPGNSTHPRRKRRPHFRHGRTMLNSRPGGRRRIRAAIKTPCRGIKQGHPHCHACIPREACIPPFD